MWHKSSKMTTLDEDVACHGRYTIWNDCSPKSYPFLNYQSVFPNIDLIFSCEARLFLERSKISDLLCLYF